eukprot:gb/GEZN01021043.1/.p1 GENE.gb/GEZN01021043.1/~~gb/GEZN01021043.1/.p1  ORF type:complete len:110 (-),score=4.10 gb/GEZN01021043.1/:85-414(-)
MLALAACLLLHQASRVLPWRRMGLFFPFSPASEMVEGPGSMRSPDEIRDSSAIAAGEKGTNSHSFFLSCSINQNLTTSTISFDYVYACHSSSCYIGISCGVPASSCPIK